MATGSLYGSVSESTGLYGIGAASGGTYFEWFIFQDALTAPATPTGGSWSFSTNIGTPPTGWVVSPPPAPVNQVWVSIAVVDTRSPNTFTWSVPGLMAASGFPILSASGVPSAGTGSNGQLYIDTATTPQSLYFKQSDSWTQLTGSNFVDLINNQTIGGVKTFSQTIQGSISGTAANVTGTVAVANGGTGATTASDARTNLGLGTIATQNANAVAITGGSIAGITDLAVADGGTGASNAAQARINLGAVGLSDTQTLTNKTISGSANTLTNIPNSALDNDSVNVNGVDLTLGAVQLLGPDWILPSYAGNANKVLALNPSASDVQWVAAAGVGTVTSIDVSGGTTGLTTFGGPVTNAGVITLDGTLGVANGGTGQTTANAAFNALAPSQTTNSGKFLTTNGTDASWVNVTGTINYQGTWNASTNTPTITSGVGVNGYYYVVSVAGSTNIDGITDWQIGDWLIFNGTVWQKIDQSNLVTSVAGRTGNVVLTTADIGGLGTIATQNANAVAITGGTATLTSLTVNDNTILGSSNTDTVTFTARINSDFDPSTNNTYDLGRNAHAWRNLFLTGTANIAALTTSGTVTHNGGTANGVSFLNASKVLTTGSALTFDGTTLANTGVFRKTNSAVGIETAYWGVVQNAVGANNGTAFTLGVDTITNYGQFQIAFDNLLNGTASSMRWLLNNGSSTSEQMRLTSTGLGIGTSSPGARLDVVGDARITDSNNGHNLFLDKSAGFGSALQLRNTSTSSNDLIRIIDSGNNILSRIEPATGGINFAEGNVGIGTSSPGARLHVVSANNEAVRLDAASTFNTSINWYNNGSIKWSTQTLGDGTNAYRWYNFTTNSEAMRIDSSGNLGLGVTPSAWGSSNKAIDIGSIGGVAADGATTRVGNNAYADSAGTFRYKISAGALLYFQNPSVGHGWYTAPSGTAGNAISFSQVMTLDASGRLLIGTTSGSFPLVVSANGGTDSALVSGIAGGAYFGAVGAKPIVFQNDATERARITSGGELCVGTTSISDGERLKVENSGAGKSVAYFVYASSDDRAAVLSYHGGSSGATSRKHYSFRNSGGTEVGSISADGTLTAYNVSSDYRLKDITGPITTSGAYIDSLNPVEGTWKVDGSTFVGLIAHEVQEASRTNVATGVKDGEQMQGMDYSSAEIIANMLAELKSLRARVAQLEAK